MQVWTNDYEPTIANALPRAVAASFLIVQPCARQQHSRRRTRAVRDRQCRVVGEDVRRCKYDLERAGLLHVERGRAVVGLGIGAVRRRNGIPVMFTAAAPSLVRVALCVMLEPTTTLPKLSDAGVNPSASVSPVPVSAMVCVGLPGQLSFRVTAPLRVPALVGVKVIVIVQLFRPSSWSGRCGSGHSRRCWRCR